MTDAKSPSPVMWEGQCWELGAPFVLQLMGKKEDYLVARKTMVELVPAGTTAALQKENAELRKMLKAAIKEGEK